MGARRRSKEVATLRTGRPGRPTRYDAVVIGSGPNGLVAANVLADAGWSVLVVEAAPMPGGGVSSGTYLGDDVTADVCSAFYPLSVASPAIASLQLEEYGLEWCHAPVVLANPLPGGEAAVLHGSVDETAEGLELEEPGDGEAWRRLFDLFSRVQEHLLNSLCTPFPPVLPAFRMARLLGAGDALRFARMAVLSVRRLGEEELNGTAGRVLLSGCTAHTDLSPEASGGAFFGWLLAMLGQRHGFPVPKGGAWQLTAALVRRLESRGGEIECGRRAVGIEVRAGGACGIVTDDGSTRRARRAVIADVVAPTLYGELVGERWVPSRLKDDLRRFQWDPATVKVDWVTNAPVPWRSAGVRRAGTVHIANSVDELTRYSAELASGEVPTKPFVLLGQADVADPSRAPGDRHVLWAYTHVPKEVRADAFGTIRGLWDESELAAVADRIEARIEAHAPGFRASVARRHVMGPRELFDHDENLVGGAINGGTSALHQQLIFRPVPSLGRPETTVRRLFLASASAHPGGGVHGACGWNAARAALRQDGPTGRFRSVALVGAQRRLSR